MIRTAPRGWRLAAGALGVAAALGAAACGPSRPLGEMRLWTDDFEIRLVADSGRPRALETVHYTVRVVDKETKEPIVNGEGRIFATNSSGKNTWNGLTYGPEVGTYRTTMFFVTSGDWAMGVQFRRDSTKALQRTGDWMQSVGNATPPGAP